MSIVLITGANKGLGREAARRLIADGHDVWLAARDKRRGNEAADLLGAWFVELDVTSDESVDAAAAHVAAASGHIDVLINNAGITGDRVAVPDLTAQHILRVFETNLAGVVRVTHALLPLLEQSSNPVIVNVSSGMGSLQVTNDPSRLESTIISVPYTSSKAALNMLTTQYAKALPHIRINAVDPGYTGTDLNANRGTQTVTEGTDAIVLMATIGPDGPTGTFVSRNGVVPW
jgi:NAD(P)-dependent dehydrogenase (short-subunit alcohol dehydrogenase family)